MEFGITSLTKSDGPSDKLQVEIVEVQVRQLFSFSSFQAACGIDWWHCKWFQSVKIYLKWHLRCWHLIVNDGVRDFLCKQAFYSARKSLWTSGRRLYDKKPQVWGVIPSELLMTLLQRMSHWSTLQRPSTIILILQQWNWRHQKRSESVNIGSRKWFQVKPTSTLCHNVKSKCLVSV